MTSAGKTMVLLFGITFVALIAVEHYFHKGEVGINTTSTPSYQEKNLEALKSAQPNDLVLCVIDNKDPSLQPTVRNAIIIGQNVDGYLHGYVLNDHQLNFIEASGYPYNKFSECEVRIVKEPFARETIGRIILHGLNPPPAK